MENLNINIKKYLKLSTLLLSLGGAIWLGIILYYVQSIPDASKVTKSDIERVLLKDTAKEPVLEIIKGKPMPGVNIKDVASPTDALLAKGEALYKNTCASCHGEKGLGDGAGGATLNPKPRNLTSNEGWKNGKNLAGLYKTLAEGIPNSGMTAYEFLPIEERFGVIHYIRKTFGGYPDISDLELKQIDDIYDLASPRRTASQIPIALAKAKYIEEYNAKFQVKSELVKDMKNSDDIASKLIVKNSSDLKTALSFLIKNKSAINSEQTLVAVITNNYKYSGFKPSIAKLSKQELIEIYNFVKARL